MAKFAQNEGKAFSPIDSKLLGTLANAAQVETAAPDAPPATATPPAPAASRQERSQPPASRPVAPEPKAEERKPPLTRRPEPERLSRVVKCLFTPSEEQELRSLMNRLRERSGITLSFSHLMRPFFDLLLQSEQQLGDELAAAGLRRPINDQAALAQFEQELAAVIHAALRKATPRASNDKD
jgi:hypothetical protein